MYWLGIDIGTGGSRALLIDEEGQVRFGFTAPHEDMKMERPQWAEQRPENWWEASQAAIRGVLKEAVRIVGREKLLFGTDYPINNPAIYVQGALFESLEDADYPALFRDNFLRLTQPSS